MATGPAPVCHLSPQVPIPPQIATGFPAIPSLGGVQNWQQLIPILNAMKNFLEMLSGELAYLQHLRSASLNPPSQPKTSGSSQGAKTDKQNQEKPARWTELSRETEKVRITNPNDSQQFVDVERIKRLTMKDGITGDSWSWKL